MKWIAAFLIVYAAVVFTPGTYSNANNERVIDELRVDPDGERARRVMLLTLTSVNAIPVNYLRERSTVYAAADFPWRRKFEDSDGRASVLIRGETLRGNIRAELDEAQTPPGASHAP